MRAHNSNWPVTKIIMMDDDEDNEWMDEQNDDSQWQKILTIFVYLLNTCQY